MTHIRLNIRRSFYLSNRHACRAGKLSWSCALYRDETWRCEENKSSWSLIDNQQKEGSTCQMRSTNGNLILLVPVCCVQQRSTMVSSWRININFNPILKLRYYRLQNKTIHTSKQIIIKRFVKSLRFNAKRNLKKNCKFLFRSGQNILLVISRDTNLREKNEWHYR